MDTKKKKIDIDERSYQFGVRIVKMVLALPKNVASSTIGNQVIRSGTSVGANIAEAQGAMTKKEFVYHMNVAKKEARETVFWLRLLVDTEIVSAQKLGKIKIESEELASILIVIVKKAQKK